MLAAVIRLGHIIDDRAAVPGEFREARNFAGQIRVLGIDARVEHRDLDPFPVHTENSPGRQRPGLGEPPGIRLVVNDDRRHAGSLGYRRHPDRAVHVDIDDLRNLLGQRHELGTVDLKYGDFPTPENGPGWGG